MATVVCESRTGRKIARETALGGDPLTRQVGNNGRPKASSRVRAELNGIAIMERVAAGMTVTAASDAVGVTRKHGSELYLRALQAAMQQQADLRSHMLAQDCETLRQLIEAHMPPALGQSYILEGSSDEGEDTGEVDEGSGRRILALPPSHQSAKIVLAALDRRAKLLGLDAAIRIEVSNAAVNEAVDDIVELIDTASDDELAQVLEIDSGREGRAG